MPPTQTSEVPPSKEEKTRSNVCHSVSVFDADLTKDIQRLKISVGDFIVTNEQYQT